MRMFWIKWGLEKEKIDVTPYLKRVDDIQFYLLEQAKQCVARQLQERGWMTTHFLGLTEESTTKLFDQLIDLGYVVQRCPLYSGTQDYAIGVSEYRPNDEKYTTIQHSRNRVLRTNET